MNRKGTKIRVILVALLGILLAYCCYLVYFMRWAHDAHVEGQTITRMTSIYEGIRIYHEKNGRWPENPSLVNSQDVAIDLTSNLPLLYFPDAKPGTEAILLAQPQPFKIGLWPFASYEQRGVRADGKEVHVRGDERGVVEQSE